MTKFRYTGDPRKHLHSPSEATVAGVHFKLDGDGVEVPEDRVERFRRNNHFSEVKVGRPPNPPNPPSLKGRHDDRVAD